MKKSTILMLIVIYIVAFFVVGLMGIKLRNHYSVSYLNQIQIEAFEESKVEKVKYETVQINEGQEISDEKKRIQSTYEFKTTTAHTADMVLKFRVVLIPENTTFSDYKLNVPDTKNMYSVKKGGDGTIFVENIQVIGRRTPVKFSLEDLQNHGIKTDVTVFVYKNPTKDITFC